MKICRALPISLLRIIQIMRWMNIAKIHLDSWILFNSEAINFFMKVRFESLTLELTNYVETTLIQDNHVMIQVMRMLLIHLLRFLIRNMLSSKTMRVYWWLIRSPKRSLQRNWRSIMKRIWTSRLDPTSKWSRNLLETTSRASQQKDMKYKINHLTCISFKLMIIHMHQAQVTVTIWNTLITLNQTRRQIMRKSS